MSAYLVFTRLQTLDRAELEAYWAELMPTLAGHQVRILAAYGKQDVLEGPETEGTVIAEFPSMEAARSWYDGPAYQGAMKHRLNGAVYTGLIVQGVEAPTEDKPK